MNAVLWIATAASFWPIWRWYFQRCVDGSDEPLGLFALATLAILIVFRLRTESTAAVGQAQAEQANADSGTQSLQWLCPTLITAYCLAFPFAPNLVRSILAIVFIGCLAGQTGLALLPAEWIVLLLCLPLISSLNFFGGFPLRLLTTKIAAFLLAFCGGGITSSGTTILWHDQTVTIDQPCSGVKMLWFSLYLGAVLACSLKKNLRNSIFLIAISVIASLFANALRVASLFFLVTHRVPVPSGSENMMHEAIGVVAFSLSALATIVAAFKLKQQPFEQASGHSIMTARASYVVLSLLLVSAAMPALTSSFSKHGQETMTFPGWPANIAGHQLKPYPGIETAAQRAQQRFDAGKINIFTDETSSRTYTVRWLSHNSREVHSAADCYRAATGTEVHWLGIRKLEDGKEYACFTAHEQNQSQPTYVFERIYDEHGQSYTDVSAWYWASLLDQTRAPWWSVTIAQRYAHCK